VVILLITNVAGLVVNWNVKSVSNDFYGLLIQDVIELFIQVDIKYRLLGITS